MEEINFFPLFLSLRVALTATLFSLIIGLPIAYYLTRSNRRIIGLVDTLITFPIVLPPTVLGYYLLVTLGRRSPIGRFTEDKFDISIVFTPTGAVIAAGITLSFARVLGDFGATLMVAGSIPNKTMTMPIAIYDALLAGNRELAYILVMIMTIVS